MKLIMKRWLTSLFLLLALAGGVLAGTPVFSGNSENGMSAMECCKKKVKDCDAKTISAAQLCCALNCGNPSPNSPSPSFNFSPSTVIISDSILKQIDLLFITKRPVQTISYLFERKTFSLKFQPKYLQHHSFLI